VVYGGNTYRITIDTPTAEEVVTNPGSFTIVVNGKQYRIDGPKQLISQQNSRLQVSTDASNTSAAAAVAAMNTSTRTSSLLPAASVSGSPIEEKEEKEKEEKERQKAESDAEYAKTNKTKALLYAIIKTARGVLKTARESKDPTTIRNEIYNSINIANSNDDVQRANTIMRDALNTLHTTSNNALSLTLPNIQQYTTTLMTCMVALAGWKANPSMNNANFGKNTARAAIQAMNGPELSDLQSFTIDVNENDTPPPGHKAAFLTPSEMMLDAIALLLQSLNGKTTIQEYTDAMKASFKNQTGKSYDLLIKTGGRQTRRNLRKHPLRNRLTRKNFRRIK
jgi:hypothetical protein